MAGFQDIGDTVVYAAFALLPCVGASLLVLLARYSRRDPHRRQGLVLACANVLVLVSLLSVVLLALESYYRFWCDTTDSFALTRVSGRWFTRHYHMNRSGFRDSLGLYALQRTPGKRRITFLGDSFTVGHGIPDVEDRFANRVRKREKAWEVHVMASNGFDTDDELMLVQTLVEQKYQFDEAVLVYCLNDIADIDPEWQAVWSRISATKDPGFLFTHSFCFNTYYYRLKGRFDPDVSNYYHFVRKAYDGPLWDEQKQRLKTLRNLIRADGGNFLVVTFPFVHELGPHYQYGPVHEKLGAFWREIGVPHLDLLSVYEPHQGKRLTVNSHDAHPSVYAHALAADAIVKFLEKNIRIDGQPKGGIPKQTQRNKSRGTMGAKLSEYHTGYRAFSREVLERLPLENNSDDFVFDNQILAQILWCGYTVAEVSCPAMYFPEASSINLPRSIKYGLGCLVTAMTFRLAKMRIVSSALFPRDD